MAYNAVTFRDLYNHIHFIGEGYHRVENKPNAFLQVYRNLMQVNLNVKETGEDGYGESQCCFIFLNDDRFMTETVNAVKVCPCYKPGYCEYEQGRVFDIDTAIDGPDAPNWALGCVKPTLVIDTLRDVLHGFRGTEFVTGLKNNEDKEDQAESDEPPVTVTEEKPKLAIMANNTLEINARAFIIPNGARFASHFNIEKVRNNQMAQAMNLAAINGVFYDAENTPLVEMWFVCVDDLNCDNMHDHGFTVTDADGRKWFGRIPSSYLPATILYGHKEGEVIDLKYPILLHSKYDRRNPEADERHTNCLIEMHLTLSQQLSRYRSFGTFEEVLAKVCN